MSAICRTASGSFPVSAFASLIRAFKPLPRPLFLATTNHLSCKSSISDCTLICRRIYCDRKTMTWCFRDFDTPGNDRLKHLIAEILLNLSNNVVRQRSSLVIHGHENAKDIKSRIQTRLYKLHRLKKLGYALKRVIFALNWNQKSVCSRKCVNRKQAKRGRTVDKHVVELILHLSNEVLKDAFTCNLTYELDFRACKLNSCRNDKHSRLWSLHDEVTHRISLKESIVDVVLELIFIDSVSTCRVSLRVKIDYEALLVFLTECCR